MLEAPIKGCSEALNSGTDGITRAVTGSEAPYTTTFTVRTSGSGTKLASLTGADSRKLMVEILDSSYNTVMADVARASDGETFTVAFLSQGSGGISNSAFRILARQVG